MIPLSHYLWVSSVLFSLGVTGVLLNRKNVITVLMSIELILLAVNTNFVAFGRDVGDLQGQIFVFFI